MSKKKTSGKGLPLTTTYLCLITALVIASATFAVMEWRENVNTQPHPQETLNENLESTTLPEVPAGSSAGSFTHVSQQQQHWPDVSAVGVNSSVSYDYCILTGVVEPTPPTDAKITGQNSIRMPAGMCKILAAQVFRAAEDGLINLSDVLILSDEARQKLKELE